LIPLLITSAFLVSLFIQSIGSPLVGCWIFFHLAGCAALLYKGGYPENQCLVWRACLHWLIVIGISTFFLAPVTSGASTMWILAAMPSLALCLRGEALKTCTAGFFAVVTVYAIGLIIQEGLRVELATYNYDGRAWPIVDPNNAALVVNAALIPSFFKALRDWKWWFLTGVFALALWTTNSKAGYLTALIVCGIVAARYAFEMGHEALLAALLPLAVGALAVLLIYTPLWETVVASFDSRLPIWIRSAELLSVRPFFGLGLGSFYYYYAQVRTEFYTMGWHTHNDLMQIAIEMGIPALVVFLSLAASVLIRTNKSNFLPACVLLAVLVQSMSEFQFYIPAVSFIAGLALANHIQSRREHETIHSADSADLAPNLGLRRSNR
jgi:O-antigen ligase